MTYDLIEEYENNYIIHFKTLPTVKRKTALRTLETRIKELEADIKEENSIIRDDIDCTIHLSDMLQAARKVYVSCMNILIPEIEVFETNQLKSNRRIAHDIDKVIKQREADKAEKLAKHKERERLLKEQNQRAYQQRQSL